MIEALEAIFSGRARLLVTTFRALQERAFVPASLAELRLSISVGQEIGFNELVDALEARGFERVTLVEEVGQFAVRGGLVDLFSFGSPEPLRVEFWGDEVTSLRAFDILDQRSVRPLDAVHVLPVDLRRPQDGPDVRRSLLELLPSDGILVEVGPQDWPSELERTWSHARDIRSELREQGLLTSSRNGGRKKDTDALEKENNQLRQKLVRLEEKALFTKLFSR